MKRLMMAFALTCVLAGSAFAGDIPMTAPTPTGSTTTRAAVTIILAVISLAR